jgi:mannitol-1-phosphate 5-dehydrogenase
MTEPACVVIGAGRLAGGFVAPLLRRAGWRVVLAGRDQRVIGAINEHAGIRLRQVGAGGREEWIDGVRAVSLTDPKLADLVRGADLLATAVGPSALLDVGRLLGPLLAERLVRVSAPLNIIAFENHRRAAELLGTGILERAPVVAPAIGARLGIAGSAAWSVASRREVTSQGVQFDVDAEVECYADRASLIDRVAPLDGSLPGLDLVRPFAPRIVEKLWVFNAGHAAAAYLGWQAGCATLHQAMHHPSIQTAVSAVVAEAQTAFRVAYPPAPGVSPIPVRSPESILQRYADPGLDDPVLRVGREPRRKLASGDRLIGPAVACIGAGIRPIALAGAAAAALAYAEPSDVQAVDLQYELDLLGPEEVLSIASTLDPNEELTRLIADTYRGRVLTGVGV